MSVSPAQLEFFWRDEITLRRELEAYSGLELHLKITDNRSSVMFVRHDRLNASAQVRLHRMFLEAEDAVIRALAAWIRSPRARKAGSLLDDYIRTHTHLLRVVPAKQPACIEQGIFHGLREMYDTLNELHFGGEVAVPITWGRMPTERRRRSIRFGSYSPRERLIRIHPLLDQDFVPDFFVRYIVFHEMLHAFLGIQEGANGRRRIHTPEFRRHETAYPDYDRAVAWQAHASNLRRLLQKR